MASNFFGPTPGSSGGGTTVSVTNFPSPQLVNINQATPGTTSGVQLTAGVALAGKVGIDQVTANANKVVIANASNAPAPTYLVDSSGNPIADNTWSGALASIQAAARTEAAGSVINRVVEAISAGVETDTLTRPASVSNFLYCTIFNNSVTLCTYTVGNANGTTGSVQPGATLNFPCNVTTLVLHATAANQQIVGWVYDPTVT
jgi:hypothetical protein